MLRNGASPDVAIVGGGVIGCGIAYELAKRGLKVTLLEKDALGSGASQAAAGMLAPLSDSSEPGPLQELCAESFKMYPAFLDQIEEEAGMRVECMPSGIIRTAKTDGEAAGLTQQEAFAKELGLRMHWLSGDEARKLEPLIGREVLAASFSPDEPHLNPSRLVEALRRAALSRGAAIKEHTPVTGLLRRGDRIEGVQAAGEAQRAGTVVLAMGSWSGLAGPWLGLDLPVYPVRGQVLYVNNVAQPLRHTVMHGNAYATPKADGTTLLGTTVEHAGFDARVTLGGISAILEGVQRLLPGYAEGSIHHGRAGLRPCSKDHLPVLGPAPGLDGVVLATGHYRSGILLTPVTAQIIAELVTTDGGCVNLGPYSAGRLVEKTA